MFDSFFDDQIFRFTLLTGAWLCGCWHVNPALGSEELRPHMLRSCTEEEQLRMYSLQEFKILVRQEGQTHDQIRNLRQCR